MSSITDILVILWFLPVVFQVVVPLVILAASLGSIVVHKMMTPHGDIARPITTSSHSS